MITRAIRNLLSADSRRSHRKHRRSNTSWLAFEPLEERQMLTTFTVTNLNDSGAGSLRDAIQMANDNPGADSINFDSGLSGTIGLNSGQLNITDQVSIDGGNNITVDAQSNSRVINIDAGNIYSSTIENITITGGATNGSGGGVDTDSNLLLNNVTITGNSAGDSGGGVNAGNGIISVTIDNSTISDNMASIGGGIADTSGGMSIRNSTISGNSASGNGGGVSAGYYGIDIGNSKITNNDASGSGGGLDTSGVGSSSYAEVNISNTQIMSNTAGRDGGGINHASGVVNITNNSLLEGNEATTGGGISSTDGELNIEDSTLTGNMAMDQDNEASDGLGGGIFTLAIVSIINSFIQNNSSTNDGAGISINFGGEANIQGSTISGNTSEGSGGGVSVDNSSSADISQSEISNNSATSGGGVNLPNISSEGPEDAGRNSEGAGGLSTVTITDSVINQNTTDDVGGGLSVGEGRSALITGTTFSNNTANRGGGIFSEGTIVCDGCTISGNTADGNTGGGIHFNDGGTSSITNSQIIGNTASFAGGISTQRDVELIIDRTTIADNVASFGGGGLVLDSLGYTITNSTISGNSARDGGGVFVDDTDGTFRNVTIVNNDAQDGGGLLFDNFSRANRFESVTLAGNTATDQGGGVFIRFAFSSGTDIFFENSIVADNSAVNGGEDIFNNTSNNFDLNFDFSLLENTADVTIAGTGNVTGVDPMLAALADNGGPTQTVSLLPDSVAIDAGDPNAIAGQNGIPGFDQRGDGFERVANGQIDMGAVEIQTDDAMGPRVESIVIQDGSQQRSVIREINVTFDSIVNVQAGAFELTNASGQMVDVLAALSEVDGRTVATLTFGGALADTTGSLIDGQYSLRIVDALITDNDGNTADSDGDGISGNDLIDDFFRLYGDADGDGAVGFFDYALFRAALFSIDGDDDFNIAFDANGDGEINLLDVQSFRDNFGSKN